MVFFWPFLNSSPAQDKNAPFLIIATHNQSEVRMIMFVCLFCAVGSLPLNAQRAID